MQPKPAAILPGALLCGVLAAIGAAVGATALGGLFGGAILAMALGIVGAALIPASAIDAGATWVVRVVLPLGIVLLGAGVHVDELIELGARGAAMGVGVIALSGLLFLGLAYSGRIPGRLAALLAFGNGICGGSAIAAAAPVLGAKREEVAVSVSAVALAGTVGTFALPLVGQWLELSPRDFGLWAGLALQQTPQVVAAGMALGPEAGEVATTIKLVRIALLVPAIFLLGAFWRTGRDGSEGTRRRLIPSFLWGFLFLSVASTLHLLPDLSLRFDPHSWLAGSQMRVDLREVATVGSQACMGAALAAIGLQTRWASFKQVGASAITGALIASLVIASVMGWLVLHG
ncbi:MAG: putative sulfate exporter family transporter [Myxococcota bacterium]|nr:putative sulfate exporter family transporter [Myxococcota bacterium]